jgi:uncharacterized protein (DUF1778 family)
MYASISRLVKIMVRGRKSEVKRMRLLTQIRVSEQQKRILAEAAAKAGLEVSSWLRALALNEARRLGVKRP